MRTAQALARQHERAEILAAYAAKYLLKKAAPRITPAGCLEVAEAFKAAANVGDDPRAILAKLLQCLGASPGLQAGLMQAMGEYLPGGEA